MYLPGLWGRRGFTDHQSIDHKNFIFHQFHPLHIRMRWHQIQSTHHHILDNLDFKMASTADSHSEVVGPVREPVSFKPSAHPGILHRYVRILSTSTQTPIFYRDLSIICIPSPFTCHSALLMLSDWLPHRLRTHALISRHSSIQAPLPPLHLWAL